MEVDLDREGILYNEVAWHASEKHLAHELKNDSSLLDKPLSTNSSVPGSIHKPEHLEFWRQVLRVDENFIRFLEDGYALSFKGNVPPPSAFAKNNKSFMEKKDFGIEEIKRLEKLGCIYKVKVQPTIVLPLSVVHSGKWRLVVDASRHLNKYLEEMNNYHY